MAKPEKAAPAEPEVVVKPKSKKMLLIIIGVLALAGAGAGWYFTRDSAHVDEVKKAEPAAPPKFIAMEPFTVNLQSTEGEKFLQIGITLKFLDPELEEKIKLHLPEIRSRILMLLSSKQAADLATNVGKKRLAQEIIVETNGLVGLPVPILANLIDASAVEAGDEEEVPEISAESAVALAASPAEDAAPESAPAAEQIAPPIDVLFTSFIIQ
jgi:flagellar FliL protein